MKGLNYYFLTFLPHQHQVGLEKLCLTSDVEQQNEEAFHEEELVRYWMTYEESVRVLLTLWAHLT